MKLEDLTQKLREYNGEVAPGSECSVWQDYCSDCHARFGHGPDDEPEAEVPEFFEEAWLSAIDGTSDCFDETTGSRV